VLLSALTNTMTGPNMQEKICALCQKPIDATTEVSICKACLLNADCCVGLESLQTG
jgi:predicted amidophosphoribosyltransferase